MDATFHPFTAPRTVTATPSKSEAHRALIAAALTPEPTTLADIFPPKLVSQDIQATLDALRSFGANIPFPTRSDITVAAPPAPARNPLTLDCHESGSTLRFLLPLAVTPAFCQAPAVTFTGSGQLPRRPVAELLQALCQHGVHTIGDHLPLTLSGTLQPGTFTLPGNVSSQYITGLLFALPLLNAPSRVILTTPLESADYITLTIRTLNRFQINILPTENGWSVPAPQTPCSPHRLAIEGDWSNAAPWLAAGTIGTHAATVQNLSLESPQGDRRIFEYLRQFGANINTNPQTRTVNASPAPLHPADLNLHDNPDLAPVLAVVAAAAVGTSHLTGVARLRLKESDRLAATANLINQLGGSAETFPDELRIHGHGTLAGGPCDTADDHRLIMAAAVAATISSTPVSIANPNAVNKSYPGFIELWNHLL